MMNSEADLINKFANTLRNQGPQKPFTLYSKTLKKNSVTEELKTNDVIDKVAKQLKAIQNADSITKYPQNPSSANKFDTQCVSDTQLIEIIKDAEAVIDKQKSETLRTNNGKPTLDNSISENYKLSKCGTITDIKEVKSKEIVNNEMYDKFEVQTSYKIDNCINKTKERNSLEDLNNIIEEPKSPILNSIASKSKSNTPSPLVFQLDSFEKFETIAFPLLKEHNVDIEVAKQLINSQILDRELFIQTHAEPVLSDRDKSKSCLLKNETKGNCKCLELNKNYVSKQELNSVFEDSLLFGSDEESSIQNKIEILPLTCVLKSSSNEEINILDKTVYVGFQTASNKSIQISCNSYQKAQHLFDKLNEDNLSAKKLVEDNDNSSKNCTYHMAIKNRSNKTDVDKSNIYTKYANTNKNEVRDRSLNNKPIDSRNSFYFNNHFHSVKKLQTFGQDNSIEYLKIDDHVVNEITNNFMPYEIDKKSNDETVLTENERCEIEIDLEDDMKNKRAYTYPALPIVNFTASNKEIKIANQPLLKTKKNFEDVDLHDLKGKVINPQDMAVNESSGLKAEFFQIADNKRLKICKDAFYKYENIPQGIDKVSAETEESFHGFKTASNRPIVISDLALRKSKNIFANIDNSNDNFSHIVDDVNDNTKMPYPTCVVAENDIRKEPTAKHKSKITEEWKMVQGFKTANNKSVKITGKGLAKVNNIFKGIDIDNPNGLAAIDFQSNATEDNDSYSTKYTFNTKQNVIKKNDELKLSEKLSFETSNDKFGLNFTEKMPFIMSTNVTTKPLFCGFKTASNKGVEISKEALEKSKNVLKDFVICDSKNEETNIYHNSFADKPLNLISTLKVLGNDKDLSKVNLDTPAVDETKDKEIKEKKNKLDCAQKQCKLANNMKQTTSNFMPEGFKTASNKSVTISSTALTASKKIFKDLDLDICCLRGQKRFNVEDDNNIQKRTTTQNKNDFKSFLTVNNKELEKLGSNLLKSKRTFKDTALEDDISCLKRTIISSAGSYDTDESMFGFVTGNNNHIKISAEALQNSRRTFADMIKSGKVENKQKLESITDVEIGDNIFDTEVIKDFEGTVCMDDFTKESPKSKRSGSPILSCPKAKKRKKFETPISIKKFSAPFNHKAPHPPAVIENFVYKFTEGYKKNIKYSIKDINTIEELRCYGKIDPYIFNFQFQTLLNFEFIGHRNDIDCEIWTTDKIIKFFKNSVNAAIIPENWIENHLTLILWKLLSYEIRFQRCMNNICTVSNIMNQLKFRYDIELYNVQRPALRKILEKDEVPTKTVILCVAGLFVDDVNACSVTNESQKVELLLTDGWYCIKACIDKMIRKLVCEGKITVGMKLVTHGAELLNCDQGIAPWEDTSSVRLKIFGNSTRAAAWHARLGFHACGAILTHLENVKPEGGKISKLRTLVTRVYPMLYVEKFADGSTVTRSERLEHLHQIKYETDRQIQLEKLYEEMEKSSDQESQDSEGVCLEDKRTIDSGSQILRLLKKSKDKEDFKAKLTSSQVHLLQQQIIKQEEKQIQQLQKRIQDMLKQRGLDVARNVIPLMKIRVADVKNGKVSKAMITIWRPNEMLQELITEGAWIDMYNIVPTSIRYSEIQISAGRQSVFLPTKVKEIEKLKAYKECLKRKCYTIKELQNPSISTEYNEADTVGFIFLIEPTAQEFVSKNQQFQNMYLTDADKNILCINFWGGIKKYGFENILESGSVISCANLQKRAGNTRKNIPQYRATELTFFTKMSKHDSVRKMADSLLTKLSNLDKRKFIDDCISIKNNYHNFKHGNTENISPYRINNIDNNVSKNKVFIDSPLVSKCVDVNLNLTGLDFESTFIQTDTQELSPTTLLRKKRINEKIATLKMYGEPPPLAPLHIINKSSDAIKPFKSPFAKPAVTPAGTSENAANDIQEENHNSSPILAFKRTNAKRPSINPVKLDFSRAVEDKLVEDPFAEDFDVSPPMSLE